MEANQLSHQQPSAKVFKSEEEQEKVIKLLEERLEKHDDSRKIVQGKLTEILNKLTEQIGDLEERISKELEEKFVFEEDRLQRALNELHRNSTDSALQDAKRELFITQSYEITENKEPSNGITTLYELKTEKRTIHDDDYVEFTISETNSSTHSPSNTTEMSETLCGLDKFSEEREHLIGLLEKRLQTHDCNREAVQDKLHEICEGLRAQIDELEDRINKELEEKFASEDNRLQAALNELRGNNSDNALQKAKAELLVEQSYEIFENKEEEEDDDDDGDGDDDDDDVEEGANEKDDEDDSVESKRDFTALYELKAEGQIVPELMEMRKPTNVRVTGMNRGNVSVEFTCFNPDEERVLSDNAIVNPVKYKCLLFKKCNKQESKKEYSLGKNEGNNSSFAFTPDTFEPETTYGIRAKMVFGDRESEWSDIAEFTTTEFRGCCVWKKCPGDVDDKRKYVVDGGNPRIATKANDDVFLSCYCTVIGNTHIPFNKVTSWNIKIHKSRDNGGYGIYIGIAPFDINQIEYDNYDKCGWYFYCYYSSLHSGPPHNYNGKDYGPRKEWNEKYVHTGDSVGVVVDTAKGELSFALNGVNLGVAYGGIPLDKPLVPCVILKYKGDSVELFTSEMKEDMDSFVLVPSNILVKSITWDTITLTWDKVDNASFYQVEVNGSKSWGSATKNLFVKEGLFPDTEYSFRVRTVRGSSVSEWSDVAKGKTLKAPEFSGCVWKECSDDVDEWKKYSVDERNPRIATKINSNDCGCCTIIGNTHIPLSTVTSWNIKILKSKDNNGSCIRIGIAPKDINQNVTNYNNGWYFDCYTSVLYSGPPHKYGGKEYGPRKEDGQYVHTGDSVGVMMDATKGELSFILYGVNCGVAYCGIPLDKPLVPCVLLYYQGDSVELII